MSQKLLLACASSVHSHAGAFRSALAVGITYAVFGLGGLLFRAVTPQFLISALVAGTKRISYSGPSKHMMIREPSGNRLEFVHWTN